MTDPTPLLPRILERFAAASVPHDRAFFGHPRGLSTLFFTEMWERFSYYGMRALLLLFMTAPRRRAAAWASARRTAAPIYGLYTSMVYMMTPARRLDRRSLHRPAPRRALRRDPDRVRPFQHGRAVAGDVLSRAVPDRASAPAC